MQLASKPCSGATKRLGLAMAALALCLPLTVQAQWVWQDSNGRRVYSDQPPPDDLPARNIIKRPQPDDPTNAYQTPASTDGGTSATYSGQPASPLPASTAPSRPTSQSSLPAGNAPATGANDPQQREIEALKARNQAMQRQLATQRAQNCNAAQRSLRTLDSGIRIARVNERGERIVLDDAGRAQERARLQEAAISNCSQQ